MTATPSTVTESPPTCRFTVRLPPELRAELERVARAHERTASQQVRHALTLHLAEARIEGQENTT